MNKIYQIRINGIIEVEDPINIDTEYSIALKRIMCQEGKKAFYVDKMDREVITWTMVNLDTAVLISGDEIIKGKAKQAKSSQYLRSLTARYYDEQLSGGNEFKDKEAYYQSRISDFIKQEEEKLNYA